MSPESVPPPAPAAPAPQTAEILLVLQEMKAAYLEVHQAITAAHQAWADSVNGAHQTWMGRMESVAARLAGLGGPAQGGGGQ